MTDIKPQNDTQNALSSQPEDQIIKDTVLSSSSFEGSPSAPQGLATPAETTASEQRNETTDPSRYFTTLTEKYLSSETEPKIILTKLLSHLAQKVQFGETPDQYPTRGLFINRQIECLEKIPSSTRHDFMRAVLLATLASGRLTPATRNIISRMLFFCSDREQLILARSLLDKAIPATTEERESDDPAKSSLQTEGSRGTAVALMITIFHSIPNLAALARLVRGVGEGSLWETKDAQLRNLVALVELRAQILSIKAPNPTQQRRPKLQSVQQKLCQISECLQKRLQILEERPARRFFRTPSYKQFQRIVREDLRLLRQERPHLKGIRQRVNFANLLLKKMKLGLNSTLLLSTEQKRKEKASVRWSTTSLADLEAALGKLPTRYLAFTPRLRQIRLVKELNGAYGQRDGSGLVKLSEAANGEFLVYSHFSRAAAFRLVAYHELCHAIHYGAFSEGPKSKASIRTLAQKSNPLTDFGEYMKLSGWEVIPPPYQVHNDTQSVAIGDANYPLNTPIRLEGKEVVLRYNCAMRTLYLHDAYARFAAEHDARNDPWEDYAEAATEYAFAPRRLITTSPWKFLHLEQTFRLYHRNKKILTLLEHSLTAARQPDSASVSTEPPEQFDSDQE